jgi:guanylate kinase
VGGSGFVITGTRGSGKTTLAEILTARDDRLGRVMSTTTRGPRPDDRPGTYAYVDEREFADLTRHGRLLMVRRYGGYGYGIAAAAIADVVRSGRQPLLTVSPDAAWQLVSGRSAMVWRGAFIDADDQLLDARLVAAGRPWQDGDAAQRVADREFAVPPLLTVVNNGTIEAATARLWRVFELAGGLPVPR